MSDQNRKTDSSANQQLDGTSAKSVEDATTARDAEESGIRKVNLRDMPPAQKDEVGGPRGPGADSLW